MDDTETAVNMFTAAFLLNNYLIGFRLQAEGESIITTLNQAGKYPFKT